MRIKLKGLIDNSLQIKTIFFDGNNIPYGKKVLEIDNPEKGIPYLFSKDENITFFTDYGVFGKKTIEDNSFKNDEIKIVWEWGNHNPETITYKIKDGILVSIPKKENRTKLNERRQKRLNRHQIKQIIQETLIKVLKVSQET